MGLVLGTGRRSSPEFPFGARMHKRLID